MEMEVKQAVTKKLAPMGKLTSAGHPQVQADDHNNDQHVVPVPRKTTGFKSLKEQINVVKVQHQLKATKQDTLPQIHQIQKWNDPFADPPQLDAIPTEVFADNVDNEDECMHTIGKDKKGENVRSIVTVSPVSVGSNIEGHKKNEKTIISSACMQVKHEPLPLQKKVKVEDTKFTIPTSPLDVMFSTSDASTLPTTLLCDADGYIIESIKKKYTIKDLPVHSNDSRWFCGLVGMVTLWGGAQPNVWVIPEESLVVTMQAVWNTVFSHVKYWVTADGLVMAIKPISKHLAL
ncbi:hypothetical protein PISMIDRAFT_23208 [Pisolithus microcarpus 441]|uniref:Uncharacterized protein n=1 Tax=Pisolithus microcarpus 441 TaxID=765257 RepID=A0A0C9Z507_9AGAM|nr:hypothetical protein BKA83DRAFT_23208 [Pisolithus microcarpus]KIK24211.1 hypothetical protein PISMIDRAFT_23208 [Pisolithus microcarpus 441]